MFDLALVLALDGSASVDYAEFGLITAGIAAALQDPDIVTALLGGEFGSSAMSVLLWSGPGAQEVMVGWTAISNPADAQQFSRLVADVPRTVRAGETAIGEALLASEALLAALPQPASRRVIDVAGDGRNNAGIAPEPVRDRLANAGVTINGLGVLHEEPDLLESYRRQIIGGPGGFAITCADYAGFAQAMRRKLIREMA